MSTTVQSEHEAFTKEQEQHAEILRQLFDDPGSELHKQLTGMRSRYMAMRATKRCGMCNAPFDGDGPVDGKIPNTRNGLICNQCDGLIQGNATPGSWTGTFPISAVDLSRSSVLARRFTVGGVFDRDFLQPFMNKACQVLNVWGGFFIEARGDELRGGFPPGFSGKDNIKMAWNSALELLRNPPERPDGTPLEFKMAVHVGLTSIVALGTSERYLGLSLSGDGITTCSLICSSAKSGEVLISEAVFKALGMATEGLELRPVELKDDEEKPQKPPEKVSVYVIKKDSKITPFPIEPWASRRESSDA